MAKIISIGLIWIVLISALMVFLSLPNYFTVLHKQIFIGMILLVGIWSSVILVKE